jgi:prepilin-type N-terminal cleavage/methylation domain-containing protein
MPKNKFHFKSAFTLIEVMVAVMIISVVIMALIQMYSNNTHIFSAYKKQINTNQYLSLLISNENYGFENDDLYIDDLVTEFDLDDELRRKLKGEMVKISYQELRRIDMNEVDDENRDETAKTGSDIVLVIGKSILKTENSSSSLLRIQLQ